MLTPTGPYKVGKSALDLYDENRPEVAWPQGRLIPLHLYFPTTPGAHTPYEKVQEDRGPKKFPPLQGICFSKPSDLHNIAPGKHPLVLVSHGNFVRPTDYTFITEELASHGCVVISIGHQLATDPQPPKFWSGRSCSKHATIIDNLLHVFNWLEQNISETFQNKIDLSKRALIGHSMGGNALLMLAERVSPFFRTNEEALFVSNNHNVKPRECIVFIDGEHPPLTNTSIPIFYMLSDERSKYQKEIGSSQYLKEHNLNFKYYPGSRHISFMDHGLVSNSIPETDEHFFNGTEHEMLDFYKAVRLDIRNFLLSKGVMKTNEQG